MTARGTSSTDGTGTAMEVHPELRGDPAAPPGIVSLRSPATPAEDERVPAFSINGTVYSIATRAKTNQGLKYVHLARTRGSEIAIDYMLETLLGTEGYAALRDFDDLTEGDLKAVIDAASKIMAGAVDAPKEKPKRGSRKSPG